MTRQPLVSLRIILCLTFAFTAEGLPERRLQPASSRISIKTQVYGGPLAYVLSMKITNRIYSPSLEDSTSVYSLSLWEEVLNLLQQIFGCSDCATVNTYAGVASISYSEGSVIANVTVAFSTNMINSDIIKYIFCNALISGPELHTSLDVDPTYTLKLPPPEIIP